MRVLLLDNYDSFTYNLYDYLLQTGVECRVVRNDALPEEEFERPDFDALVLSPGPGRPENSGAMPLLLAKLHDKMPMLGICLGHQAIGEFFGARLGRAAVPVHGKTSSIRLTGQDPVFEGLPQRFSVMRYHSLLLENLDGTPLRCLARTGSGEIMALAHRHLPIWGLQFHPESILTEHGLRLLQNWTTEARRWTR